MAIIVDKVEKRRNIALSCSELLLENGIKNLTISQLAKTAGIGKGTIYEYFKNKEDIVFEIIKALIDEFKSELEVNLKNYTGVRDKVFNYFDFIFNDEKYKNHRKIYIEFLAITLTSNSQEMIDFNIECKDDLLMILRGIFQKGVDRREIKKEAMGLVNGLFFLEKGLLIEQNMSKINAKIELKNFINTLFNLIEIKEK